MSNGGIHFDVTTPRQAARLLQTKWKSPPLLCMVFLGQCARLRGAIGLVWLSWRNTPGRTAGRALTPSARTMWCADDRIGEIDLWTSVNTVLTWWVAILVFGLWEEETLSNGGPSFDTQKGRPGNRASNILSGNAAFSGRRNS